MGKQDKFQMISTISLKLSVFFFLKTCTVQSMTSLAQVLGQFSEKKSGRFSRARLYRSPEKVSD